MVDVPAEKTGQASGSQSTVRQVGSALGIAVIGTLLFTGTGNSLETKLADLGVAENASSTIVQAVVESSGGAIPGIAEGAKAGGADDQMARAIQTASGEAFTDGARLSAYFAAAFLLVGLLTAFRLGRVTPSTSQAARGSSDDSTKQG